MPAAGAAVGIRMQSGGANEASDYLQRQSLSLFPNLRTVKALMKQLLERDQDRNQYHYGSSGHQDCLGSAFSTGKDQTAELLRIGAARSGADPLAVLKALGGHASLAASSKSSQAAGYSTTLPSGNAAFPCTPIPADCDESVSPDSPISERI